MAVRVSVRLCECVWLQLCVGKNMSLCVALSVLRFFFIPNNDIVLPMCLMYKYPPISYDKDIAIQLSSSEFLHLQEQCQKFFCFWISFIAPSKARTHAHTHKALKPDVTFEEASSPDSIICNICCNYSFMYS